MKKILLEYADTACIEPALFKKTEEKLSSYIESLHKIIHHDNEFAFISIADGIKYHESVINLAYEKKKLHPASIVVCGIGGSNLGTIAIIEALYGKLYNQHKNNKRPHIYFADTVDADYIGSVKEIIEHQLKNGHQVIINGVTKSGTTTETIATIEIFLDIVKKYQPRDYHEYIVITTDPGSPLEQIARKEKFSILSIPKKIGGRYSVFTAAGLFPLLMLDVNIQELLHGARDASVAGLQPSINDNNAAISAIIQHLHYTAHNLNIHDLFLFSVQLESIGKWYRQLVGESLGKEHNIYGKKVEIGITPTVSVGSIDLHSVGQLYLGGPRDKSTTFVTINAVQNDILVPSFQDFEQCVANVGGASLSFIMNAIIQGVKIAYKKNKRPYYSLEIPELSPYYIGQFMQMHMIEIVYLAHLLEVNPFDQPHVELYKKETRKILAHE
jgi:glucose-6-phosphate isomerase